MPNRLHPFFRRALFAAAALIVATSFAAAPQELYAANIRTVALSTWIGGNSEDGFSYPFAPVMNNAGETAFRGNSPSDGPLGNYSIWSDAGGALAIVAQTGTPAPGDKLYSFFWDPQIDNAGRVAFRGRLGTIPGTGLIREGVWMTSGGQLRPIAVTGQLIEVSPSGFEYRHQIIGASHLNKSGQLAYAGFFFDGVPKGFETWFGYPAIWSNNSGVEQFVESGQPGRENILLDQSHPASPTFQQDFDLQINGKGEAAFEAFVTGAGVNLYNQESIWRRNASGFHLIARQLDPAPIEGAIFYSLDRPVLNCSGRIAFSANTIGAADGFESFHAGIWIDDGAGPYPIVLSGDKAPGTDGAPFDGIVLPLLNDEGDIAFQAGAGGRSGIWRIGSTGARLVALEGDIAPGAGMVFDSLWGSAVALNSHGQVAFNARLRGTGFPSTLNLGLWALDRDDQLQLIAQLGDSLTVAPGDVRTIAQLAFSPDGLNDGGQLAFSATFTDGSSGIFVSNVAAVPEPHSGILFLLASFAVLLPWKQRNSAKRHETSRNAA